MNNESAKKQNAICKDIVKVNFEQLPEQTTSKETTSCTTSAIEQDVSKDESNPTKKPIECMTDEEIIQENLKELLDKKNREERKANGRYIAVIVAFLVIFLAIYHAWIRKTGVLAGVLVPAVIMVSYGCWVVILAKRDKQKRALFKKHLEEIAAKNKTELIEKAKLKHGKKNDRKSPTETTTMQYENELTPKVHKNGNGSEHRKQRKHRNHRRMDGESGYQNSLHVNQKDPSVKRPSFRQKLFRQNVPNDKPLTTNDKLPAAGTVGNGGLPTLHIPLQSKKKRLQRLDALPEPHMVRMSSAP